MRGQYYILRNILIFFDVCCICMKNICMHAYVVIFEKYFKLNQNNMYSVGEQGRLVFLVFVQNYYFWDDKNSSSLFLLLGFILDTIDLFVYKSFLFSSLFL
eukprot:TRINITY_DN29750_c1_g1_i1.p5 TRINITY_DN29750_c1_g1~~TRINITY_DN29750_c1_g1_i1.p5  ORF type:complete len:101 (-),score=1.29 TRINITY_DN29750_c1_g1_i1:267-569(-)